MCGIPGGIKPFRSGMWQSRLEETLPFPPILKKSACPTPPFLVTVSRVLLLWTFHMQSRKSLIWKGARRGVNHSLCLRDFNGNCFKTQNWESSLFYTCSVPLSPDVYGSLREGINACTQRDEWLNLDLGGTEWDNRQSLQKALWWKCDNLQASSPLVRRSNCMTGLEWRTDARKKSSGI